MLPPWVWQ
jgi:hypothetical protein